MFKPPLHLLFVLFVLASCSSEPGDGYGYRPYYFESFFKMSNLRVFPSSESEREVEWEFLWNSDIPREEFDDIRKELGDIYSFCHGDAFPCLSACVNDFSSVTMTSDAEYEGIAGGESLNSVIVFVYRTCLPWVKNKYCDEDGIKVDVPIISEVETPLDALNPKDLDGCLGDGKLVFPSTPAKGQLFKIVFSGGDKTVSKTFCLVPES